MAKDDQVQVPPNFIPQPTIPAGPVGEAEAYGYNPRTQQFQMIADQLATQLEPPGGLDEAMKEFQKVYSAEQGARALKRTGGRQQQQAAPSAPAAQPIGAMGSPSDILFEFLLQQEQMRQQGQGREIPSLGQNIRRSF